MPQATTTDSSLGEAGLQESLSSRPRIALVAASLDILGGQGVQARALCELLEGDGHEVVFVPINPAFPRGLKWLRRIPFLRTLANQVLYVPSLLELRRGDVVHIFSASYWSFLVSPAPAILMARLLRKRVVLNYHSGEAEDHLENWGWRVHPFLRRVDEIVVPSEYLQAVFARWGYRARVVRNVIDTSSFPFRERNPLQPRFLSIRNFERHYRIDVVLKAFVRIRERYPRATLTVAGYGSEERQLRGLAASLGMDGIRFVGKVDPARVPALYEAADVFLNASVIDNQPISVLEAFAAGVPVISTNPGDIVHMVRDGETGVIVPQDDPDALAAAAVAVIENPDRAAAMARRARAESERFTWEHVREGWAAAYAEAGA